MNAKPLPSLRSRLAIALTVIQLAALALVAGYLIKQSVQDEVQSQRLLAQSLIGLAEPAIIHMIDRHDVQGLRSYVGQFARNPSIRTAVVSDSAGLLVFRIESDEEPLSPIAGLVMGRTESPTVLSSDLLQGETSFGRLEAVLSNRAINQRVESLVIAALIALAGLAAANLVLSRWLLQRATAPLRSLTTFASRLQEAGHDLQDDPPRTRYREVAELEYALEQSGRAMGAHVGDLERTARRLAANETHLRRLIENMREVVFELDANGIIRFANPAWQQVAGCSPTAAYGKPFSDFLVDAEDKALFAPNKTDSLDVHKRDVLLRTAVGASVWVELDAHALRDAEGKWLGIVGSLQDISERLELTETLKRHQDELYALSITDALTGLYNRRHFDKVLTDTLPGALERDVPLCLMLVDLDGFKFINDVYGHPIGDKVLKAVADLLTKRLRSDDTIARLAGDEFAVILHHTSVEDATAIARTLLHTINETRVPLPVGHLHLQASIGVAVAPVHGVTAQELVGSADVALYHAKRRGRGRFEVLPADISQGIREVFSRGFELRNALAGGDIQPSFQPIIDLSTGEAVAYEVLATMQRGGVMLPASEFIKVAEDLGLVQDIDLHVIEKALSVSPPTIELFLNISLLSFHDTSFGNELFRLLKAARHAGRAVTIEITERTTVTLSAGLHADLQRLRDLGCKIALDDFGYGYSTYTYVRRFKPEYIKIEGSYVAGILAHQEDHMIVQHIHELAAAFGAVSIAENIESPELREAVMKIGIHYGQGFHYGKPAHARDLFAKSGSAA